MYRLFQRADCSGTLLPPICLSKLALYASTITQLFRFLKILQDLCPLLHTPDIAKLKPTQEQPDCH